MQLTPDDTTLLRVFGIGLNATIVNTWIIMALLTGVSALVTRKLRADVPPNRWRTALEVTVSGILSQIAEVTGRHDPRTLYFVGTLFLFIVTANILTVVPGFATPTASLSTTAALAISVLVAVPIFGIGSRGLGGYLRTYIEPSIIMLPFNLISEVSRGISLAIRLYGNIMSGAVIAAILLSIAPFFFPVVMDMLGLLTGIIQAYIFAILATVYISSATAEPPAKQSKKKRTRHERSFHHRADFNFHGGSDSVLRGAWAGLGRGARSLDRAQCHSTAARRGPDPVTHALREPRHDRVNGHLLFRRRHDPDLRQSVLECGP